MVPSCRFLQASEVVALHGFGSCTQPVRHCARGLQALQDLVEQPTAAQFGELGSQDRADLTNFVLVVRHLLLVAMHLFLMASCYY